MSDDFKKYERMRQDGSSPEDVYRQAVADRIDLIARIRMLRSVFHLSHLGAKAVVVGAEGRSQSLDEHQEKVADELAKMGSIKQTH